MPSQGQATLIDDGNYVQQSFEISIDYPLEFAVTSQPIGPNFIGLINVSNQGSRIYKFLQPKSWMDLPKTFDQGAGPIRTTITFCETCSSHA